MRGTSPRSTAAPGRPFPRTRSPWLPTRRRSRTSTGAVRRKSSWTGTTRTCTRSPSTAQGSGPRTLPAGRASKGTTVWYRSLPTYRQGGQTVADVNGDGAPEILVGVASGTVYNLRGTDGSTFWSYNAG